jgi:hypothetical protein
MGTGRAFPVNPVTLEATSTGIYDPCALARLEPTAVEVISHTEWTRRRNLKWDKERLDFYKVPTHLRPKELR